MKEPCVHCGEDEARRNRLCVACSNYERKLGRRPGPRVLYRREQERKRRAQERTCFVVSLGPELARTLARLYAEDRRGAA